MTEQSINENVIPKYFYHYMKGTFLEYIGKAAVNSSVTSIRRKMLDDYPVPVPSVEIQNKNSKKGQARCKTKKA